MNVANKSSRRLSSQYQVRVKGGNLRQWMALFAARIREAEPLLTRLDAAIGDADHGINMRRGMDAVEEKLGQLGLTDFSGQVRVISTTLLSSVGGASGPLFSAFFLQFSHATVHQADLGLPDLATAVEAGCRGVVQLGKAAVGDKTMVDVLAAASRSLHSSCNRHESLPQALESCVKATREAAASTIPMVARKGRASYLGERSAGTQDPGATSAGLLFESLARAVTPVSLDQPSNHKIPILL